MRLESDFNSDYDHDSDSDSKYNYDINNLSKLCYRDGL